MDLHDAFAELGLDATADAADVRAAYLRLLRTRSPERDPAGFQRLRAAYEHLKTPNARVAFARPSTPAPAAPAQVPEPPAVDPPVDPGAGARPPQRPRLTLAQIEAARAPSRG